MQISGKRPKLGEMLLQHVIVFLICVVFPGATTLMAPSTWLTFQRGEDGVSCTARTCMFFVVPFKVQRVQQVTEVTFRERAGGIERQRKYGRDTNKYVHVDGEGFLRIQGTGEQFAEVSVSPASIENVAGKANDFVKSNQAGSTTIFAIANWKFGGLMGGVLSMFTLLYVVGYSLTLVKLVLVRFRSLLAWQRT
jgi:hypothetical protein